MTPWTAARQASLSFTISQIFAQAHVHWVDDAIQPSHPLLPPSPFAFDLSQHQGLFQGVSSSHQVANILELQHQFLLCLYSLGVWNCHFIQWRLTASLAGYADLRRWFANPAGTALTWGSGLRGWLKERWAFCVAWLFFLPGQRINESQGRSVLRVWGGTSWGRGCQAASSEGPVPEEQWCQSSPR